MSAITHLLPVPPPPSVPVEVSIVIPTLNERGTVVEFVRWCHEGLAQAGVAGQILLVDSSTDETPQLALAAGAEVLLVPRRGLGRAYLDALPYLRGKLVLMGDADLTYDFRELRSFVEAWRQGGEFIIGSRFLGEIESGAMPPLHRYFGTPATTWLLNRIYHSNFSDIHCGMRALTRDALLRMDLQSQSWEYASEIVLKAVRLRLRCREIPIRFYKDRQGRLSHHKRAGWLSPWIAGWINLKVMLVYAADRILIPIGLVLFLPGLGLSLLLRNGPVQHFGIGFQVHWLLFGMSSCVLGFGLVQVGLLSRYLEGVESARPSRLLEQLTYNRGILLSAVLATIGLWQLTRFVRQYIQHGYRLDQVSYPSLFALLLLMLALQNFGSVLALEMCRRRFLRPNAS